MLVDVKKTSEMIRSGKRLFLAGEEALLASLPKGEWIGGSIPYFMADKGGKISRSMIFATEVPQEVTGIFIKTYTAAELPKLASDAPENGFTLLIIPASSEAHLAFAQNAPNYEGLFMKPTIGWISGVHLDDLSTHNAKVMDGKTGRLGSDFAIAMHCGLPVGKVAEIGIVNLFKQGSGDTITFEKTGFQAAKALANGKEVHFASYLREKEIDTRLPLVADYAGTMVNVSFQAVKDDSVVFYAPVFAGVEYRIAEPVENYVQEFSKALPGNLKPAFSCNCILNFLYSELEGKNTAHITGPVTFGEIAYQLLNQTLVYLKIH